MNSFTVATVATVAGMVRNGCFRRVAPKCRDSAATLLATLRQRTRNQPSIRPIFNQFWGNPRPNRGAAAEGVGGSAFGAYPRPTPFVNPHRGMRVRAAKFLKAGAR